MKHTLTGTLMLALHLGPSTSQAQVHDEASDGDLSGNAATPTALTFAVGSNVVVGTMQASSDTRDFITFTVPAGTQLTALHLLDYTDVNTGSAGDRGYHALNLGDTSEIPAGGNVNSFLGGNHLTRTATTTNLLDDLATAPLAGTGFTVPLGADDYSYVIQQTGPELTAYELEFVIEVQPPAGVPVGAGHVAVLALLLSGFVIAALRARRLRRDV